MKNQKFESHDKLIIGATLLTQMNKIYVAKSKDLDEDQWKINFMDEFIDVVHQIAESGLSPGEAKDILCLSFLVGIYFNFIVFVFFLIRKCMWCA